MAIPPRLPGILGWLWQAGLTQQQWRKYNATLEAQIREGRATREAQWAAVMSIIEQNPHTQQSQMILQGLYENMPEEMERGRAEFLSEYDRRMGDVTGLLDEYGTQQIEDIRRTFGEEKGAAMGRLVEQGLAGGGVASSIGHGFATREADALARAREQAALVKANSLYDIESGRAAYDAAMRGNIYGTEIGLGQGLANFQTGWGQQGTDTFERQGESLIGEIYGVQNVPPQTDPNLAFYAFSGGK